MKCKLCGSEIAELNKTIKIKELGIEVDFAQQQNNNLFSELVIPQGWRLLKLKELDIVMNYIQQNKLDIWSYFEQPINEFKGKFVARFEADSGGAYLDCGRDPDNRLSSLGVIFCRDLKVKKGSWAEAMMKCGKR